MLTTEQLSIILNKDKLNLEDLLLLEDHLLSIARLEQDYDYLPVDVVKNLNDDVESILDLLKRHRAKTQKTSLKLLKNDNLT
jgi:hypothetical protein